MFLVMPYGICSATEVFQKYMDQTFGDIEGVSILVDDLIVSGWDKTEHDKRLKLVLQRAKEEGLKFIKNKCKFNKTEVKYIGHIFTGKGIKISNDRVKAITEMPKPKR